MPVPRFRLFSSFVFLTSLACTAALAQGGGQSSAPNTPPSSSSSSPGAAQSQGAQKQQEEEQQLERPTSTTTAAAPQAAQKALTTGLEAEKNGNLPDAQKKFEEATQKYPGFAEAWEQLGVLLQRENQVDDAEKAFQKAIAADPKFAPPYFGLAGIATQRRQWNDAARLSQQAIDIDPINFTGAYLVNSIANFNLGRLDMAETSARQGYRLDSQHRLPMIQTVLARILLAKKDYPGAIENFNAYLQRFPNAPDAADVRRQLAAIQQGSAMANTPATSTAPKQ